MNRKISSIALFLAVSIWAASCHVYREPATIIVVSGTPQTTLVGTNFGAPLVVQVLSKGGRPVHQAAVTFAPPSSGASATTANTTIFTDKNGMATSGIVTANDTAGAYQVLATVIGAAEPAVFNLTNTAGTAAGLACTGGTGQSTQVDTAFALPLGAQVVDSQGNPVVDAGVVVTFTAPAQTGPSVTFAGGVNTATTNAAGLATSVAITANGNAGTYNVSASATIADAVQTCSTPFSLTNTAIPVTTENFVYYAIGNEKNNGAFNLSSLAGVVTIETSGPAPGTVMGGEQDFNDGNGITATDPITGGTLTLDATTGLGTLTIDTSDTALGGVTTPQGDIVLAVQFVNAKHALVVQFDGSATSSGSMDLQTSTSLPTGGFAFTVSGVDSDYFPAVIGGIFTISGNSISGTFDLNDSNSGLLTDQPFTASIPSPDANGRGTLTSTTSHIPATVDYFVVGPEVMRIIDMDALSSAVGSAFGQGDNTFSKSSLGTFVFEDVGNPQNGVDDAVGMLTANSGAGTMSGVVDLNDFGTIYEAQAVPGSSTSYSIAANGYGNLMFLDLVLGDVTEFGIYMTDPNLNLNDPNNTSNGTGGALIADLGDVTDGVGVITPQTSTATSAFAGEYGFGAQLVDGDNGEETDFLGQGKVTSNALNGTGDISDPYGYFGGVNPVITGATFTGTATPDGSNPGRYLMSATPLAVTPPTLATFDFTVAVYQASGDQLFWVDDDTEASLFAGPLEQQGAVVTPLQAAAIVKPHTVAAQNK